MQDFIPDAFPRDSEFLLSEQALPVRPSRAAGAMFGSARIANRKDLESLLTPHPNEQHVTRLGGVGLILELPCGRGTLGAEFGCTLCLSEELRNRHMLFVAKPGGGKTTRGILPLLLADIEDEERTVVSFETKGNHHPLIAHWTRRHRRKKPVVLNLTDPRRSVGWNPVRRDLTRTEAYDIAFTLCTAADRNSASQDSSFWINNAVRAMTGILLAIARDPDEQPCLGRVHEILDLSRDAFLAWSERNKDIPQIEFFRSFLRSNSHNAETCLADMSGRMATFLDMNLCATTSADELDLSTLTKQPTVLIVEIDEAQIEKLRPVYNLLFSRLLAALIDAADARPDGRLQRPVSIIADEFASAIGRIPDLPVRLNTMRSRRISFVAAVQSIGQIKHVYGDATESVLAAFNTRVFFPALELQDACYASALSGITTVENRVETSLFTEDWEAPSPTMRRSWTTSSIGRPLFLPGEISQPPTHFALGAPATFFLADTPPFQAWLTPSYQLPEVAFALRTIASARPASRKLRRKALAYAPRSKSTGSGRVPDKAVSAGFTDPSGLSEDRLRELLENVKQASLDWEKTTGSARKWWTAFENENKHQPALVLRLAEELAVRKATVTEFFLAYVHSNTDNIQANLSYLDYTRLKRLDEQRKQQANARRRSEAAANSRDGGTPDLFDPPPDGPRSEC